MPQPGTQGTARPKSRRRLVVGGTLVLVLALVLGGSALYYAKYSKAARLSTKIPISAEFSDVGRIAGNGVIQETVGGLRYVVYPQPDFSRVVSVYVVEKEERRRKVPKQVTVTKTRKTWRQVGWYYFTGLSPLPRYDWVDEQYQATELQLVDEVYEIDVWRVRSVRPGFDLDAVKNRLRALFASQPQSPNSAPAVPSQSNSAVNPAASSPATAPATKSQTALVTVPKVVGLSATAAKVKLKKAGFKPVENSTYGPQDSDAKGMGVIYRQKPSAGAKAKKGVTVTIFTWWESQ